MNTKECSEVKLQTALLNQPRFRFRFPVPKVLTTSRSLYFFKMNKDGLYKLLIERIHLKEVLRLYQDTCSQKFSNRASWWLTKDVSLRVLWAGIDRYL